MAHGLGEALTGDEHRSSIVVDEPNGSLGQKEKPAGEEDTSVGAAHWPPGVAERAQATFGAKTLRAPTKTHALLDKQIGHALRVWRERYAGELELNASHATPPGPPGTPTRGLSMGQSS